MFINNEKMRPFKIMSHQCHNREFIEIWFEKRAKIICFGIQRKNRLMGRLEISDAGHIL